MPKRKLPIIISKEELEKKTTIQLFNYLKQLWRCEESFEHSDMDENLDLLNDEIIYFKQTEKWQTAYRDVKAILNTREHLQNVKRSP